MAELLLKSKIVERYRPESWFCMIEKHRRNRPNTIYMRAESIKRRKPMKKKKPIKKVQDLEKEFCFDS